MRLSARHSVIAPDGPHLAAMTLVTMAFLNGASLGVFRAAPPAPPLGTAWRRCEGGALAREGHDDTAAAATFFKRPVLGMTHLMMVDRNGIATIADGDRTVGHSRRRR